MNRVKQLLPFLLVAFVIILDIALFYKSGGTRELNKRLENDTLLADYPYPFRVQSLNDGIAELSTPRSSEVPVKHIIGTIYPELRNSKTDSPTYMRAQKDLATHQAHARGLVLQDPSVNEVIWKLDKAWLTQHGVQLL
jgi:hypothetical protein